MSVNNANIKEISIALIYNFYPKNFIFISAQAQIISNVEGHIIANKCYNTPCPQVSFLRNQQLAVTYDIY